MESRVIEIKTPKVGQRSGTTGLGRAKMGIFFTSFWYGQLLVYYLIFWHQLRRRFIFPMNPTIA